MWLSTQYIQEVKMKGRKQFKVIFYRKPGEIVEAEIVDNQIKLLLRFLGKDNQDNKIFTKEDDMVENALKVAPPPTQLGLLSHLWSTRKNIFISSGIQMLVMLAIVYLIKRLLLIS